MKRLFTLISAIAVGMASMIASTLSDIKSEIAKIEGVTVINATPDAKGQEVVFNKCEMIMLTPETIDKVKPILSKIPEDMIFADVDEKGGAKTIVWTEPEEGTQNGEMLMYINAGKQQMLVYTQGNLKEMEAVLNAE